MLIFAVGPRQNQAYTQAREPAVYCCLRSGISPAAECWPELRRSAVLSIWPPKPLKQLNVRVPHLPIKSWSGTNQVTEPPGGVGYLRVTFELAAGSPPWRPVAGGGAAVWPTNRHVCVTTRSTHTRKPID